MSDYLTTIYYNDYFSREIVNNLREIATLL